MSFLGKWGLFVWKISHLLAWCTSALLRRRGIFSRSRNANTAPPLNYPPPELSRVARLRAHGTRNHAVPHAHISQLVAWCTSAPLSCGVTCPCMPKRQHGPAPQLSPAGIVPRGAAPPAWCPHSMCCTCPYAALEIKAQMAAPQ